MSSYKIRQPAVPKIFFSFKIKQSIVSLFTFQKKIYNQENITCSGIQFSKMMFQFYKLILKSILNIWFHLFVNVSPKFHCICFWPGNFIQAIVCNINTLIAFIYWFDTVCLATKQNKKKTSFILEIPQFKKISI